ncbi:MAG: hypothetical protein ACOYN4_07790 [Bacteroidales bacterium]
MKTINDKLKELYTSNNVRNSIKKIVEYDTENNTEKNLDGPFYMYCWEEYYEKVNYKVLYIGQEASGGFLGGVEDKVNTDEKLINKYKHFNMGKEEGNGKEYRRRSAFWRTVWAINQELNPELENENCFLWTNVSKYCTTEGKPISYDDHAWIVKEMNILQEEIKIANPDVVIFFSGPNYDDKICIQFDDSLVFEQVDETIPLRELARVKHRKLPENSFRTYHPKYLQIANKHYYIQLISGYCKGYDILELIRNFEIQLKKISEELNLELYISNDLGQEDSYFYFHKNNWTVGIGFGFDKTLVCDFFGGICAKDLINPLPENAVNSIQNKFGMSLEPTRNWPFRFQYDEYQNWYAPTFDKVKTGELANKIKVKVEEMTEQLNGIAL